MPEGDSGVERELWEAPAPLGGWGRAWPQCVELARALPSDQWTLVGGGLMVHLHAAVAGLAVTRPTADVDIVLHIETGAASAAHVTGVLAGLGYRLHYSLDAEAPAHRFVRGDEQIDVMVADHPAPKVIPRLGGRRPFQLPAGTQAVQRTVNCRVGLDDGDPVLISIPNTLGALVLKGAAYQQDKRDGRRHLDDAAVLLATVARPLELVRQMKGSDRSRILVIGSELVDPDHQSWRVLDPGDRDRAITALGVLSANPDRLPLRPSAPPDVASVRTTGRRHVAGALAGSRTHRGHEHYSGTSPQGCPHGRAVHRRGRGRADHRHPARSRGGREASAPAPPADLGRDEPPWRRALLRRHIRVGRAGPQHPGPDEGQGPGTPVRVGGRAAHMGWENLPARAPRGLCPP